MKKTKRNCNQFGTVTNFTTTKINFIKKAKYVLKFVVVVLNNQKQIVWQEAPKIAESKVFTLLKLFV